MDPSALKRAMTFWWVLPGDIRSCHVYAPATRVRSSIRHPRPPEDTFRPRFNLHSWGSYLMILIQRLKLNSIFTMASAAEVKPELHNPDTRHVNETTDSEKIDSSSDGEERRSNIVPAVADNDEDKKHFEKYGTNDRYEITEEDCWNELGFSFPTWKKWTILTIVFSVQVSMNFNTSLYSNAINGISEEFGVSAQAARVGAAVFLITYAFGCEIFAPWSEELGRWPILQLSLFLVNIWQIPVGIASNFATIIAFRALGGLCTAGGSVTLAMVADMWVSSEQQYAVVSRIPMRSKVEYIKSNRHSSCFLPSAAQS